MIQLSASRKESEKTAAEILVTFAKDYPTLIPALYEKLLHAYPEKVGMIKKSLQTMPTKDIDINR